MSQLCVQFEFLTHITVEFLRAKKVEFHRFPLSNIM